MGQPEQVSRGNVQSARKARSEVSDRLTMLPDSTMDDTDAGWGESTRGNDERLLADRPPHWG